MVKKESNTKQKDTWAGASHEQHEIMAFYEKLKAGLPSPTSAKDLAKVKKMFSWSQWHRRPHRATPSCA